MKSAVTYKMIAEALFENFESIYDIHLESHEYKTYYQSDFYQGLRLAKEGEDFFEELSAGIARTIAREDREFVFRMLQKEVLVAGIEREKYYRLVYRIQDGDNKIYHQLRATFQDAEDGRHILMGIKNVDDVIRQKIAHEKMKKLEEELEMSRIRNSTSQMKPHFLYNVLGSIQELILTDPQYASDLLGDFMIHMRSCVRAMTADGTIPFAEELKNIKAYVNIEKMRLGERLEMCYELEETDFPVLPLSIQPLVENAIRHGVFKRGRAGGRVTLRTKSREDMWIVQVEDSGVGFDADQVFREIRQGKRDSSGLNNLRFRLEKVLGGFLEIRSTPGVGTVITVMIPRNNKLNI